MDFLWTNAPGKIPDLLRGLDRVGVATDTVSVAESGSWGTLVATTTPYMGLSPHISDEAILVAVGDPLLPAIRSSSGESRTRRSRSISDLWGQIGDNRSALQPQHPAALMRVDRVSNSTEVVLDAFGGVPVFTATWGSHRLVGTTPDLLAATAGAQLDVVSAAELMAAGRIAFPNSLYLGITQLMPGSHHNLTSGKAVRWWRPPHPDLSRSSRAWAEDVEDAVRGTLREIVRQLGRAGLTTLSAGRDTRAVASLGSEAMDLTAVVLTGAPNLESWTARRVARRLDIPLDARLRPPDHYLRLLKSRPLALGTGTDWLHAHFHSHVLSSGETVSFILGGYNADTLFRNGGGAFKAWSKLKRSGSLPSVRGRWPVSSIYEEYPPSLISRIEDRWSESMSLLGITPEHNQGLSMEFPFTQRLTAAHFNASRRNGPQYEPFMTEAALRLGFLIPEPQKDRGFTSVLFRAPLRSFRGIPINPGEGRIGSRFLKILSLLLPDVLAPRGLKARGSWSAGADPLSDVNLAPQLREALVEVERLVGLSSGRHRSLHLMSLALQIETARRLGSPSHNATVNPLPSDNSEVDCPALPEGEAT